MDNAFLGKNGFSWWVGVVEDNKDPLRVSRCRVRIFGWHTEDKNLIPTEDLPWSQASLPVNNSLSFSVPQIGEWVTGHFLDGEAGQFPIYTGVLPGVIAHNNIKNPDTGFNSAQTAGPSPAKTTQAKDGSGSVIKSEPFVSFPISSGIPTTNLEAMHLEKAKPLSVTDKIDTKLNDIFGPRAASTGDKITTAVLAVAATSPPPTLINPDGTLSSKPKCGPDSDSLLGDINNLVTKAGDLLADTEKFINEGIDSAAASAASSLGITSGLNAVSGAIDTAAGAAAKGVGAITKMMTTAEDTIAKGLSDLTKIAAKYEKEALDSLNKKIDDLSKDSGAIGCYILGSITPPAAKITTILPVIVDPATKTAQAVVGAVTYPLPVAHDLPAVIPLQQIPSAHTKSLENTIEIWKQSVLLLFSPLLTSFNNLLAGKSVGMTDIQNINRNLPVWNDLESQIKIIPKTYGLPEIESELNTYWKPYNTEMRAAENKMPKG